MADQNITPIEALSDVSLMLTLLTGANDKANQQNVEQMSDLMGSQTGWQTAATVLGGVAALSGSLAMMGTGLSMGGSAMGFSKLSALSTLGYFGEAGTSLVAGASGVANAVVQGEVQVTNAKMNTLQANSQVNLSAAQSSTSAVSTVEQEVGQIISNLGQSTMLMPVR